MKRRIYLLFLLLLTSCILFSACSSRDKEITVGFLYSDNIQDNGFYRAQDLAREEMVKEMNGAVQTIVKDSVDGNHVESVIYDMVNSGAKLIFVSDNQLEPQVAKAASVYDYVDFVIYNGNTTSANAKSYRAREYEIDYLEGILAAKMTKTNRIGYIAPDQSSKCKVRINAFALGVQSVNKDAIIDLDYVANNVSQSRINASVSKFTHDQCDVVCTCSTKNKALIEAADKGIKVIGNTPDGLNDKDAYLSAVTYNFKNFYIEEINSVLKNSFDNTNYVGTLSNGFLDLDLNGPSVSQEAKRATMSAKQEILRGNLVVFTGPIVDNAGNEIKKDGEVLTESDLTTMNFLLSNIKVLS